MGCVAVSAEEPLVRVIPIEYKQVNEYLDYYPKIIIQKLKEKFHQYVNQHKQLPCQQFTALYAHLTSLIKPIQERKESSEGASYNYLHRLYAYFNDMKTSDLRFKEFVIKYSILNRCDKKTLSDIIYFLISDSSPRENSLNQEEYIRFAQNYRKYFGLQPQHCSQKLITKAQFFQSLRSSSFNWDDYQKQFSLIDKMDMPFQIISKELLDLELSDLKLGQKYYLVSSSWFQRWAFYYQGKDHTINQEELKETKLMRKKNSQISKSGRLSSYQLLKKKKKAINRSSDGPEDDIWLIEQPTQIQFDDIEGEFQGQLKENLRPNQQCKIITQKIWELLKKLHPSEKEFARIANSRSSLQLYPKTIYFLKTNKKGQILDESLKILQVPNKMKLKSLSKQSQQSVHYFIKEFDQLSWNQEKGDHMLAQCSIQPRFFVVETSSKVGFIGLYSRRKITLENISYGDCVYSYFPFNKEVMKAFILRLPSNKTVKIHYTQFNFRYEIEVSRNTLSIHENEYMTQSIKSSTESENYLFKGLQNIGNTCFINSVIQSLIATPILGNYFEEGIFDEEKQPMVSVVSKIGKSLLKHQKIYPIQLKKNIDIHLEVFSGYHQHDAQQFLSLLLDKMDSQIPKKPSIIEQLFTGIMKSTLKCCSCQNTSEMSQKISILSLPIPEPEYNTYTIIVFPIYGYQIKKVILRLHRYATIRDYITMLEDRIQRNIYDYLFYEVAASMLKKKLDLLDEAQMEKLIVDKGIATNIEVYAFEKLKKSFFLQIEQENKKKHENNNFFDIYDQSEKSWAFGKYINKKKNFVEKYIQNTGFVTSKIENQDESRILPLGTKVREIVFKKFNLRKYNSVLKGMEFFGYQLMIGLPRYFTFQVLERAISICLKNYVNSDMIKTGGKKKSHYLIKVVDTIKHECIFCRKAEKFKEDAEQCCSMDLDLVSTPIIWLAKQKNYSIYVDWVDMACYNYQFASSIQVDSLSSAAQKQKHNDKINLNQCFSLILQPEKVQMECNKCHHPEQFRTEILESVPSILVLHMKEFRISADKILLKLDVNLKWVEFMDISRFSLSEKGNVYEMYAYVKHMGSNQSGHYTCVTKRKHPFESKKVWVNFDDDRTEILNTEQKNISFAYLLFFKKVDMPISTEVNFTEIHHPGI